MAKKRGRPRKDGPRDRLGRLIRDGKFTPAPDHILEKRKLFSFVTPSKGPDGRTGEIDQDICDGIGQFHALGLLDGHGLDPQDLRDKGREWRNGYVMLLRKSGFKTGSYERMDKSKEDIRYTGRDAHFDRLDECLRGFERTVLLSLLVDPIVGSWPNGEEEAPWVRAIIGEALLKRGRILPFVRFPDANDRELLKASIRGLCSIVDASLPNRWERAA
jgi:hypothetical protein